MGVIWAAWVTQAALSMLLVRKFCRRRMRRTMRSPAFTPPAAVIVPFKGIDVGLEDAIAQLCRQDYPRYRLVCVVQSRDDPAAAVLHKVLGEHPDIRADIVIAGDAPPDRGQKVHNQLVAMRHVLDSDATPPGAWVFADSDAVVGPGWLAAMLLPLQRDPIGATTGYRWLVPDGDRPGIWSHLASVINSSAACLLGSERTNHAWGGSMATLHETAERGGLIDRLEGAVTDDYPVTHMCRTLGLGVFFVPAALVPSPVRFTSRSLTNFAYRQYLITRVYAPRVYLAALGLTGLYTLGLATAVFTTVHGITVGQPHAWVAGGVLLAVGALDAIRGAYRRQLVRQFFDPGIQRALRPAMWLDRWATWLWMPTHFALVLSAGLGSTMTWRGIRYRVRGPNTVERLP